MATDPVERKITEDIPKITMSGIRMYRQVAPHSNDSSWAAPLSAPIILNRIQAAPPEQAASYFTARLYAAKPVPGPYSPAPSTALPPPGPLHTASRSTHRAPHTAATTSPPAAAYPAHGWCRLDLAPQRRRHELMRSGMHADILRAWHRQHGRDAPVRSPVGGGCRCRR